MSMDAALHLNPALVSYSFMVKGGIMAVLAIFSIGLFFRKSTYSSLDVLLLASIFAIFLSYSFFSQFPSDAINRSIKQLFLSAVYFSFIYFLRSRSFQRSDLVLLSSICFAVMLPSALHATFDASNGHLSQSAGPYTILWLLLFSFLVIKPGDRLLMVLMLVGTLVLLLIMKRGAILCMGTAFVAWMLLQNRYYPRLSTLANSALAMLVFAALAAVFWVTRGEQFADRLHDTSGSGRDILYGFIFRGFIQADTQQLFFGHGSMAVQILSGGTLGLREGAKFGLQAHSDWLTLAYDFGLLGVTLFAVFHIVIFRKIRRLRYEHTGLYVKLLPVYLALFLNSIFSEIFFNTSVVFLYLFLAIASSPHKFRTLFNDT